MPASVYAVDSGAPAAVQTWKLRSATTVWGWTPETLGQLRRAFDTGKSSLGFGLVNVHQRIRLTYGKDYGLTLDSTSGQGTVVTVRIPTIEEDHDVENIDLRR